LIFDRRAAFLCLLAGLAPLAPADEAKPAAKAATVPEADDELLEFLGSVDSDTGEQDWIDYLAQTDIAKVAKKDKKTAPVAAEVKKE
jgi:hypothetical protein